MKTTSIFKALALGLLSLALTHGPAHAAGLASCPVWNASMVDAAALAAHDISLSIPENITATDDPSIGEISCEVDLRPRAFFSVEVKEGRAQIFATGGVDTPFQTHLVNTIGGDTGVEITTAESRACRNQVIQSWVWNEICASLVE